MQSTIQLPYSRLWFLALAILCVGFINIHSSAHDKYKNQNKCNTQQKFITIAKIGNFNTLNGIFSHLLACAGSGVALDGAPNLIIAPLMFKDPVNDKKMHPLIAQSMSIKDNTVTFVINKDARWADGHHITAHDIKFSIHLLQTYARLYMKNIYKHITDIHIHNDYKITLTVNPKVSNYFYFHRLAATLIFPHHYLKDRDLKNIDMAALPLSGPYCFGNYKLGQYVEYVKQPNHWTAKYFAQFNMYRAPGIKYIYYHNQIALQHAMRKGHVDFYHETAPLLWQYYQDLLKNHDFVFHTHEYERPVPLHCIVFNCRRPYLSDINVRKTLTQLFDVAQFNKLFMHQSTTATQRFFANDGNIDIEPIDHTPVHSNITIPVTLSILINNTNGHLDSKIANYFVLQAKKAGITLKLITLDQVLFWHKAFNYEFDMLITTFPNYQFFNPYILESRFADPKIIGRMNMAGMDDPRLLQLCQQLKHNPNDYKKIMNQLNHIILAQHYILPLFHWKKRYVIHKRHIILPKNINMIGYIAPHLRI